MGQLAAGDTFRFIQPTEQAAAAQLKRQKQWLSSIAAAVKSGSAAEPFPLDVESEPQAVTDGVIKVIPGDEALDAPSLTFKLVSLTRSLSRCQAAESPLTRVEARAVRRRRHSHRDWRAESLLPHAFDRGAVGTTTSIACERR